MLDLYIDHDYAFKRSDENDKRIKALCYSVESVFELYDYFLYF